MFLKILLFLFLWFQKWRLWVEALAGSGTQTISSEKDPKNPNPNPSPNPPIPQRQLAEPVTGFHWSKPSRLARSLSPETPSLSSGSGGLSESLWTLNPMLSLRSVETQSCSFYFVFPFFFVMLCLVAEKMRGKRSVKFETFESYVFVVLCLGANGSVYLKVEIIYNFLNFDVYNFCLFGVLFALLVLCWKFLFNKLLSLSDEPQNGYCVVCLVALKGKKIEPSNPYQSSP